MEEKKDCCEIYPAESDEVYELYQEYRKNLEDTGEGANNDTDGNVVKSVENLTLDEMIQLLSGGKNNSKK